MDYPWSDYDSVSTYSDESVSELFWNFLYILVILKNILILDVLDIYACKIVFGDVFRCVISIIHILML